MTKKIALVFPGQGSQYIGMGKNLEGTAGFELLARADEVLGYKLSTMMLEGSEDDLKMTMNTQPAIVCHSLALWSNLKQWLNERSLVVDVVAGHSVGEYAALAVAGVFSPEEAIKLVHWRGKYMQEATPVGVGTMYALLKLDQALVESACEHASQDGEVVTPANFNDPSQIVISGHVAACERAVAWLKENANTPHRAIELKVSAPFHSPLMESASAKMRQLLDETKLDQNTIAYLANIDAELYSVDTDIAIIKKNLEAQIAGSVRWTQSIQKLSSDTVCVEVGPGKVLNGLIKKINPALTVISLDKEGAMSELEEALK
jgi:[acyl-carrier-protein] S-malonyltransferase